MIKTLPRSVCLWFLLGSCVAAQDKVTKLRGTVQDATTKNPVAGATVSASGDTAQQSEITDGKGFFRLLIEGVPPGDLVHIRVEKAGYAAYDQQFAASEEIPLNILLRRTTTATPPPNRKTIEPAAPVDPVTARFVQEMKDPNYTVRLNALKVLVDSAPTDSAAMSAVIAAALDFSYQIKLNAIQAIERLKPTSKDAVTNLLVDLHDIEPLVQAQSIDALGSFPKDKDAQAALFRLLGTPPSINERAMYSLVRSGVEDPRLSEAIFYEVTIGNQYAVGVMSKETPLSPEWISRLIAELGKNLDFSQSFKAQGIIRVLLKGGGEAGHKAMHQFLATADPYRQSRLVLCWLEVDHKAKDEILQVVRVTDITTELRKALASTQPESVFLSYVVYVSDAPTGCSRGVTLRAAMGMLMLDLEPHKDAWDALAFDLDRTHHSEVACSVYSGTVLVWLGQSRAKPIIPLLIDDLRCNGSPQFDFSEEPPTRPGQRPTQPQPRPSVNRDLILIVKTTLVKIGDEDTITLLQQYAAQGMIICGHKSEDPDPDGKKRLADLIARIRSRTDK
ncbi:carboxypeptidase regulatory-like domain-containing protein [Tunturibacter psychrotolerans]|uniref:Carboxypeptidase regulatory-like domain-containing protein n=1 Tax=Tunturiibacter psychrotolerans TaxID=3069686 RepID=A0AAU7ZS38_9BACT